MRCGLCTSYGQIFASDRGVPHIDHCMLNKDFHNSPLPLPVISHALIVNTATDGQKKSETRSTEVKSTKRV